MEILTKTTDLNTRPPLSPDCQESVPGHTPSTHHRKAQRGTSPQDLSETTPNYHRPQLKGAVEVAFACWQRTYPGQQGSMAAKQPIKGEPTP